MNMFANITEFDDIAIKDELITDGILDVLHPQLNKLHYIVTMKNYVFCYYHYQMLEITSLTIRNLTKDRRPKANNYNKFAIIAATSLSIAYTLDQHYRKKLELPILGKILTRC